MYKHTYFEDKIRVVHPTTGDFIMEYFPGEDLIVVTKHKKTATIRLNDLIYSWEKFNEDESKNTRLE